MQMRTGTAAGCTDKPDLLAISYRLPCFDKNLFKVRIARADAMAVVDLAHAAELPSPAGMGDPARCCGLYLRLHCRAAVEPAVGRLAAVERIGPGSEAGAEMVLVQWNGPRQGEHYALQFGLANGSA